MLSFFRSVLGLNGSQSPSSETERLRRVSKELARLEREDRRAPLSPRVSAKRKAVENAATPIAPKLRKLTLAVEEATPGSDLGENTPTAEMCSHARGVENECGIAAKRKRVEPENHEDVAEQLTPPPMKKAQVGSPEASTRQKRKATDDLEGKAESFKKSPVLKDGSNKLISSSKRKASDMESPENGDRARLAPPSKVIHNVVGAKPSAPKASFQNPDKTTPRHSHGGVSSSRKSKKSPAYYRNLAKACRSKRLQFSI
eukprot:g2409.t1